MCGIVAVLNTGPYAYKTDEFFSDAMLASQVRGVDSSGIFQLKRSRTPALYKIPSSASHFLSMRTTREMIEDVPTSPLTIGHVRAATAGAIATNNAHPFKAFRDDGSFIVGVHNGTLQEWRTLVDGQLYNVDSEWALNRIATEGLDAFKYIKGAYAFVWWDSADPDHMFMVRNWERTLYYMLTAKKESMLITSELGMLGWLAERNKQVLAEGTTPYYLEPGMVYKFSLEEMGKYTATLLPNLDMTAGKPSTPPSCGVELRPTNRHTSNYGVRRWLDEEDSFYGSYSVEGQETILAGIKDSLRAARYAAVKRPSCDVLPAEEYDDGGLITSESLEKALARAINTAILETEDESFEDPLVAGDPLLYGDITLAKCNESSCTEAEVETAKEVQYYGLVVEFSGTYYDESESVLYGEFKIMEDGKLAIYEACLRYIPSSQARDVYMNPRKKVPVAVVGMSEDLDTAYVSPLTPEQRAFVNGTSTSAAVH